MKKLMTYKDTRYVVLATVETRLVRDQAALSDIYSADLILRKANHYWILQKVLEAEFEEIKEKQK